MTDTQNQYHRTAALLMAVFHLSATRAEVVGSALDAAADEFSITSNRNFGGWVAQMGHESGGFRYSDEIWGPTPEQQRYDTRTDLGNTPAIDGDGYTNRGAGWLQETGDDNLTRCAIALDIPRDKISEQLRNDPLTAARGAAWHWVTHGLPEYAERGDIDAMSGIINRGDPRKVAKHATERRQIYAAVMRFLALHEPLKPLTLGGSRTIAGVSIGSIGAGATAIINAVSATVTDPQTATQAQTAANNVKQIINVWQDMHALGWMAIGMIVCGLAMILWARVSDRLNMQR